MKKYQKILACVFILVAVLIMISLPELVYPTIDEDGGWSRHEPVFSRSDSAHSKIRCSLYFLVYSRNKTVT